MCDFDSSRIVFPVSFELRVIYELAREAVLREGLDAAFAAEGVSHGEPAATPKTANYGTLSVSVTFGSQEQMRSFYARVGKVAGVKAII